jgi:thioredoxin reductase (NADPH)
MAVSDLELIAFPRLTDDQIRALDRCTHVAPTHYPAGATLIKFGDRDFKFFVIKEGEIEILDQSGDKPRTLALHKAGEFTGDSSHITGAPAIFDAVTRGECVVWELTSENLRGIVNECAEIGDIILKAFLARRQLVEESKEFVGLRVIGSRYSQDTFRVREFLSKNRILFTWFDLESDPAIQNLLENFHLKPEDTPVVMCRMGKGLLKNPSNRELGEHVGMLKPLSQAMYDLVIVGSGPAGLAAAVYAGSEGLRTIVLDSLAPGGQAGSSMRIENYLGFPAGITGRELTDRAKIQANKFGVDFSIPSSTSGLSFDGRIITVHFENNEKIYSKCLLIATGAEYRKLGVLNCEAYEGRGVYYAATPNEIQQCGGKDVIVIGGGNSAGQAAVFLALQARTVYLVVRGDDLGEKMSSYLVHRIEHTSNIEVHKNTVVATMQGGESLEKVVLLNNRTKQKLEIDTPALFSFIGAMPRTGWLPKEIMTDEKGFIKTGWELGGINKARPPLMLETSQPGVFAAGDVRSGSVKRVASAVGEGAMAVQFVHEYLRTI